MQSEPGRSVVGAPKEAPPLLEGPPIRDPFAAWESVPPAGTASRPSRAGTAALLFGLASSLLGPLAGVPAVLWGLRARAADQRVRGTAGLALGATFSLLWPIGVALALLLRPGLLTGVWEAEGPGPVVRVPRAAPEPLLLPPGPPGPAGTVPQDTLERTLGTLVVVDVGVREESLESALREQWRLAEKGSQKLLVTTTRSGCEPCDGLVSSLPDPLMQQALEGIRLVRVDIDVFGEDLEALRMPSDTIPGFFLLREDLTPRDWIHGGEWGLDVAVNIAPVLGPFVRGNLHRREHTWRLPPARRSRSTPSDPGSGSPFGGPSGPRPRGPGGPSGPPGPPHGPSGPSHGGGIWL